MHLQSVPGLPIFYALRVYPARAGVARAELIRKQLASGGGGFQNPYNHNPYCVGILIGYVWILIGGVGILIGSDFWL